MTRRRIVSLIAFSTLVAALLGGGLYVRNFLLTQVKRRIQSVFSYDRLRFRVLPPALILENVRTVSSTPSFSARRVSVRLPLASLLKNQRPLAIAIDEPVLQIPETGPRTTQKRTPAPSLSLPFVLERATVNGGAVFFSGRTISAQIRGIKASFWSRGESLMFQAETAESSLSPVMNRPPLTGEIELRGSFRRNRLMIDRLILHGPPVALRARGTVGTSGQLDAGLRLSFSADMNALAGIIGLPFEWAGDLEGEGDVTRTDGVLRFRSSLSSDNLKLNGFPLEKAGGTLAFSQDSGIGLDLNIQRRTGNEGFSLRARPGVIQGEFRRFHLEPVISYLSLPWPVRSPAWGNFSLDDKALLVNVEFREGELRPVGGRYALRGPVQVAWNLKDEVDIASSQLETAFGRVRIDGKIVPEREVDLTIQGEVSDVSEGRVFTSRILPVPLTFPEIRGRGEATIRIKGEISRPEVRIDFDLSPAGFDRIDVAEAKGWVEVVKESVSGLADIGDPAVSGRVDFSVRDGELAVGLGLNEGDVEQIFSWLNLKLPLRGRAGGIFDFRQRTDRMSVEGRFFGQELLFSGQRLKNIDGELAWNPERLTFPRLSFDAYGGKVFASSDLDFNNQKLSLDLKGEKIDLSSFHPNLSGELDLELKRTAGEGQEAASGKFTTRNLLFTPFQPVKMEGRVKLDLVAESLRLEVTGNVHPDGGPFTVQAGIPLTRSDLDIQIQGRLGNLNLLLPWKGARGGLDYLVQVRGVPPAVEVSGGIDLQGSLLPFPQFAHALEDFSGLILIKNNVFSVRSFKGKLGGGEVQGGGEFRLGKGGVENIDIVAKGENLLLSPLERTRALTDVSLRLLKDPGRFVLEGDLDVRQLSWRREIFEKFAFSSSPFPATRRAPGFFDDLMLNLRLRAEDNAWLENSLGRLRGRFDLTVSGNVRSPILLGTIETLSGDVFFQDRKFQVLQGRLSFVNPTSVIPYLDFQGETYVKDYRVTFSLTGFADRLKPEFSSSPPLPAEDVLALLALGEAFKRSYSADTSTQLSTASLLSFQLTGGAARRAEELFRLDRFRIDPFLMGSSAEMTARLTVGKKISRDFYIYYSTNLTKQTEEIIRLEWDISRGFSLVGTRNEFGRVSFDVKIRRRF